MTSSFDPTSFMNQATTGAMDTEREQVPAGEYDAWIDKLELKSFPITKGDRAGETLHKLEVMCKVVAPGTDYDGRLVRKDCILDITPQGALDNGKQKNIDLGAIREAVGLNDPVQPFAPAMLVGRQLRILVIHDPDRKDPEKSYARVSRVAKAA